MTKLATVERLALELPEKQRAKLAVYILESLPALFFEDDGGLAEARRRDDEMDENPGMGISLEDMDHQISNRRR